MSVVRCKKGCELVELSNNKCALRTKNVHHSDTYSRTFYPRLRTGHVHMSFFRVTDDRTAWGWGSRRRTSHELLCGEKERRNDFFTFLSSCLKVIKCRQAVGDSGQRWFTSGQRRFIHQRPLQTPSPSIPHLTRCNSLSNSSCFIESMQSTSTNPSNLNWTLKQIHYGLGKSRIWIFSDKERNSSIDWMS